LAQPIYTHLHGGPAVFGDEKFIEEVDARKGEMDEVEFIE
jgi:hypothetical protein